jgi:hypothetical protein
VIHDISPYHNPRLHTFYNEPELEDRKTMFDESVCEVSQESSASSFPDVVETSTADGMLGQLLLIDLRHEIIGEQTLHEIHSQKMSYVVNHLLRQFVYVLVSPR